MQGKINTINSEAFFTYTMPKSKRVFDIFISSLVLILFLPLLCLAILLILIESRGPVFFVSKRAGNGTNIFKLYKLRTMYVDSKKKRSKLFTTNKQLSEKYREAALFENKLNCPKCKSMRKPCSPLINIDDVEVCENMLLQIKNKSETGINYLIIKQDPRITFFGKVFRFFNIDEIPKFYNVLKGDLSLVGNKPLPLYEAEQLSKVEWGLRFLGPTGITGIWNSPPCKKKMFSRYENKHPHTAYILNVSLWRDFKIAFFSLFPVFFRQTH